MIISLSLAAAMGILVVLLDGLGDTGERILLTSLLVGAFSLICLACAIVLDRRRVPVVMWLGVGTSLAALAVWIVLLWIEPWGYWDPWFDISMKIGGTLTTVSIWSAHLGVLLLLPLQRTAWRRTRLATFVSTLLLGISILIVMWGEVDETWMFKLTAIVSILASCGTVVTPILALIEKLQHRGEPVTIARKLTVELTCPRCGLEQRLLVGPSKCKSCGLQFTIDIEEPRCACGYPLYKLESDRCPECGREIPPGRRWPSAPETPIVEETAPEA